MTSGFSGNFSTEGSGAPRRLISSNPGILLPQQQGTMLLTNQNTARRTATDLLIGKRSFSDFQSFHQHNNNNINFSQQQSLSFQQQYLLMRSLRQKTDSFVSSPSSTRLGLPVYQPPPPQQQLAVSLLNNNNYSHNFNALNNNNSSDFYNVNNFNVAHNNCTPNNLFNPGLSQTQHPNLTSGSGFLNPAQPDPKLETSKIMNTLQELEKELFNDDDDENNNLNEPDPVSGITNSEWSETYQNLIEPGLGSNPVQDGSKINHGTSSTTGSNNSVNNNSMISSSPTSSASSCCSTSASPATGSPVSINQLITEATVAISDGKVDLGKEILTQLFRVVNKRGSSEQRLGFYMAHALQSRAWPCQKPASVVELYGKQHSLSNYLLHEMSPCFKFGLLAANLVLLDAINFGVQEKKRIHIIDFHVGHAGGQYVNLLRALGERRHHSRVALKITLVNTEVGHGNDINEWGESETVRNSLLVLAEKMGIHFEFEVVTRRIAELTRESLGCEASEVVLVNFAFWVYRVPDESVSIINLRDELLRRVKGLSPRVVTLVEQDMNANTTPFVTRVNESCTYYGALFDSLELTRDNPDRILVEEGLGRKLLNAVACEGPQRVERTEVFGKWRARMGMARFELKPLNQSVAESMRVKLNSVRGGNPGFTVKEENGGLSFGWREKTITVTSAWR